MASELTDLLERLEESIEVNRKLREENQRLAEIQWKLLAELQNRRSEVQEHKLIASHRVSPAYWLVSWPATDLDAYRLQP